MSDDNIVEMPQTANSGPKDDPAVSSETPTPPMFQMALVLAIDHDGNVNVVDGQNMGMAAEGIDMTQAAGLIAQAQVQNQAMITAHAMGSMMMQQRQQQQANKSGLVGMDGEKL